MTLRFDITPIAQDDILDHAFYLSDQSMEISDRFYDNVFLSLQRLSDMPELGSVCYFEHADVYNIRIWPVKGFRNYLIFYRIKSDCIQILRVLHGSTNYETFFQ
jgi:toxin ParE1/3/4